MTHLAAVPPLPFAPASEQAETSARAGAWLNHYDDKFLACRIMHDWPRIVPHRRLTRTTITRLPDADGVRGVCMIAQRCGNCGRERWRLTGPRGMYEAAQKWHYREPGGYSQPAGYGLTRSDFAAEYWRRIIEDAGVLDG